MAELERRFRDEALTSAAGRDDHPRRRGFEVGSHFGTGSQGIRAGISKRAIEIVNEWRARGKLKSEIGLDAVAVADAEEER